MAIAAVGCRWQDAAAEKGVYAVSKLHQKFVESSSAGGGGAQILHHFPRPPTYFEEKPFFTKMGV